MCLLSEMMLTDDTSLEVTSIDDMSVTDSVRFLFRDLSRSRSVRASDSYKSFNISKLCVRTHARTCAGVRPGAEYIFMGKVQVHW